ncbi:MAG: DNRLRE domain-containing protein [Thermoanaerobaculia bacterium]|nr:DNRLRE domain-containing protein [Thermoanaerobaculia bacterium]
MPHGLDIEPGTSEQIATVAGVLATDYAIDANVWETGGTWLGGAFESEHWHITSSEVSPDGFPGLADLLDEPAHDASRDFQYAVSIHGFGSYDGKGLVLGGRAHREAKCFLASRIQQRLIAEGRGAVAFYIWDLDGVLANNIDLPDVRNVKITDERGQDPGLSGTDRDNVVNRVSPNETGAAGFGGFQVEQSRPLRDDATYRNLVAEEIAHALGELITKPSIIDGSSTAICDALEAGEAPPIASISGKVWRDQNDNGVQDAGEEGVGTVSVELLGLLAPIDATTTAADGSYAFDHLETGSYQVRVTLPDGFEFGPRDAAAGVNADEIDSDVDETTGETFAIVLAQGQQPAHVDAGIVPLSGTAAISGRAWIDVDSDGYQQNGEGDLEGVMVTLLSSEGLTIASQATSGNGGYSFGQLAAGSYRVRFAPPAGWSLTDRFTDLPAVNSDPDPTTGETELIVLVNGQSETAIDAGFTVQCHAIALVGFGSQWRTSTTFAAGWHEPSFDDSAWGELQGSIGYPAGTVNTTVTDGVVTAYFRHAFTVADEDVLGALELLLFRDDGAVVYLNGQEVFRSNMPAGAISQATSASSSSRATVTTTIAGLVEGLNVLAVEVHNRTSATTVDLAFDLELWTTLCQPCITSQTFDADRGTFLRLNSSTSTNSTPRGDSTVIEVDGDPVKNALLAWPLPDDVADAVVIHAELELTVSDDSSASFRLFPLVRAWDEASANWYDAQAAGPVSWGGVGATDPLTDYDATSPVGVLRLESSPATETIALNPAGRALVEGWLRGEIANDGLVAHGGTNGNGIGFASDETPTPPKLRVVYATGCGG